MKHLLLNSLLLAGLVGCGTKGESDPSPAPAAILTGQWMADAVYSKPITDYGNLYLVTYSGGKLTLDGTSLTVTPGIFLGSTTASATTGYSLQLPLLRYAAQTNGAGSVDSFLHVTATSFIWHHYQYALNPSPPAYYPGDLVFATFHR